MANPLAAKVLDNCWYLGLNP